MRRLERLRGREIEAALEALIGRMVSDLEERLPPDPERELPGGLELLHACLPFAEGIPEPRLRHVALGEGVADDSDRAIDFKDRLLDVLRSNLLAGRGGRYELEPPVRAYLERWRPPGEERLRALLRAHTAAHLPLLAAYDEAIREGAMTYSAPAAWAEVTAALEFLSAEVTAGRADEEIAQLLVDYVGRAGNVLRNNYGSPEKRVLKWYFCRDLLHYYC
jgi:hypothetical protein